MSWRIIYLNNLLVLMVFVLEIKSDVSQVITKCLEIDQYGKFVRESLIRNQITDQQIDLDNVFLEQLGDAVDENMKQVKRAEEEFENEPSIQSQQMKDKFEQLRLKSELDASLALISNQFERGPMTETQYVQNRNLFKQRLLAMNNLLKRRLEMYTQLYINKRRAEEGFELKEHLKKIDFLNKYEQYERATEPAAHLLQRKKVYEEFDKLAGDVRKCIELLQQRHAELQPIDEKHNKIISVLENLWGNLGNQWDQLKQYRIQMKAAQLQWAKDARSINQNTGNNGNNLDPLQPSNQYLPNQTGGMRPGIPSGGTSGAGTFGQNSGSKVTRGGNKNG